MDFLKKHGFAVGLAAFGLLAAVLLYLMVIQKIWGGLAESRTTLGDIEKSYGRYTRQTPPPSVKSKEVVEKAQKVWEEAFSEANKFYDTKKERFEELHDEFVGSGGTVDDTPGFKTFYETRLKNLREEYLAAPFRPKEAAPPEPAPSSSSSSQAPTIDPSKLPPIVQAYTRFNNADDVKHAMKELWIVIDVYNALTALKLGGLQDIAFPERDKAAVLERGARYSWIRSRVIVEMPFLMVEPFLAKLFQSDRVPFRLDSMTMKRHQETVIVKMVSEKPVEEPTVEVTFDLSALNWVGVPASAPAPEKK